MTQKKFVRSFAGGEITPELFARLDLAKNQTGLAKALNFEILAHGPAANRAGWEYVLEVKDSSKHVALIPFTFNTQQTFVLEFGELYVRFHSQGGTLLEAPITLNSISSANPGVVGFAAPHGLLNGQWVYLNSIVGPTILNGRFVKVANKTANTFELNDLAGNPINTALLPGYISGGTVSRVYEVATPYTELDLFDLHYVQSSDVLTITHPTYQQRELRRLGATNWTLTTFTMVPVQAAPTALVITPSGAGAESNSYKVTAVAADGFEESLASASGTTAGVALATAGAFNTIKWTDAANATRYNVYKLKNGLYGFIGQALNGTIGLIDNNIGPLMSETPPEGTDPFAAIDNYPGAVSYYEQRRIFAGSNNKPQNMWMTRSATESNLTYSIPQRDDDSISFRIAARQANRIRHIVPLADLILLTSGGAWRVTSVNSDAITPSSISVKPQSNVGASNVQPVIADRSILYAQDRGGHIREMKTTSDNLYTTTYGSTDASILAPHLFDDYTIRSMSYVSAPTPQLWATRSDGILLGLTYIPEHDVLAWHQHDTKNGLFESVAAVAESNEDSLYAVILRTINGRSVRYIERKHTRKFAELEDAFFVDSGLTYEGLPATLITGFWHLEGETISLLCDGAVHPPRTVVNGAVTLEHEASMVHGGLKITADMQTLPVSLEIEAAGQGIQKNVNKINIRLHESSLVKAGPSFDALREVKQRTDEPYGSPPRLMNAVKPLTFEPSWGTDGAVCLRTDNPLPVTVVGIEIDVALGG